METGRWLFHSKLSQHIHAQLSLWWRKKQHDMRRTDICHSSKDGFEVPAACQMFSCSSDIHERCILLTALDNTLIYAAGENPFYSNTCHKPVMTKQNRIIIKVKKKGNHNLHHISILFSLFFPFFSFFPFFPFLMRQFALSK